MNINMSFNRTSELRKWLERKNFNSGSPEAFDEWLQNYFDVGNSISVRGEEYDYCACRELV